MEVGETPEEALKREIWEELETRIVVERFVETVEWDYPALVSDRACLRSEDSKQALDFPRSTAAFHLTMHCYLCHVESGHLELKEHEAAKWLWKDELESVQWLPADRQLIESLLHPLSYNIWMFQKKVCNFETFDSKVLSFGKSKMYLDFLSLIIRTFAGDV